MHFHRIVSGINLLIQRDSMNSVSRTFLIAAILLATPLLHAQVNESSVMSELKSLATATDLHSPSMTIVKIASEIRTLPAGPHKLQLADILAHLSLRCDPGLPALQSVAETLAQSLTESSISATGELPMPYIDLAKLVHYEHVKVTLDDPLLTKATRALAADDADLEKADFTLKDLQGRDVTLSQLRGKVVLVNFWATWCGPCRLEMLDLNDFYSQGLVVLSITNEESSKVSSFVEKTGYAAPVLLDPDSQAAKRFHVDNLPRSFVFNRRGKLVAMAVDQRSRRQFVQMLAAAGLHP
jgi:peroxiredoxin